jgi:pimeloyl-ACP methyl ester carboxylesterase
MPYYNLPSPTLGGRQFWGDVLCFRGYRIQQHVLSRHYRLLDPGDVRLAWGSLEDCRQALEAIKSARKLAPLSGKAVILIHGIIRSSKSMSALAARLKGDGYETILFDYPSTRTSIADSAAYLAQVLASLEGIDRIDLVVHSMGGLLVRAYLQAAGAQRDPRLRRMVMLGVPNQGARMANLLQSNLLFQWTLGAAGQQLIEDPAGFIASLPVPDFEFAIIAGARGRSEGWNPFVSGDDDGTVSVASARLSGAADFMTVPALHTFMISNPAVIEAAARFLETGALRASGVREPL